MPTFLSDPTPAQYVVLFVLAVVAVGVWWRYRDRRSHILVALALLLLGGLFLCDRLVESPREEATAAVIGMAEAATAADGDRFVRFLSDRVDVQGAGKERIRRSRAWDLVRQFRARVAVWGFGHDTARTISDTEVEIGFMAKAQAADGGFVMRYVTARFVKDPDGAYRVKSVKFYNPAEGGMNAEDPIPGFP